MKYRVILFILSLTLLSNHSNAQLQVINTIAGKAETGFSGDGSAAFDALLNAPLGVAVDGSGNVFILDTRNYSIRKVSAGGTITTVAGSQEEGYSGDGSIAQSAKIIPSGIAADNSGNLYIADASFGVIRKVNGVGIISTIAGTGTFGFTGDNGPATSARIGKPHGLFVDTAGSIYFADAGEHVVRKINKKGIISTIAGTAGVNGYAGDGDLATLASLDSPYAVAVDLIGNVFISDFFNNVIRKVDKETGNISTYAGSYGLLGYSGDGGMATDAMLNNPRGIAIDSTGNLFIADAENNVVRKVDVAGIITTVVGNGSLGFGGDGGYALSANLHNPFGVSVDRWGSIYVADANNQRIRKAYNPKLAVNNVNNASQVGLYPNPCTETFALAGLNQSDKVGVYDMTGRLVSKVWTVSKTGTSTFDVSTLSAGMYVVHISGAYGSTAVLKLIKE